MSARFKVEMMLKDEDRQPFYAELAHPRTTVDTALQWLLDRQYKISRNAVWRFKNNFKKTVGSVDFQCDADARHAIAASIKALSGTNLNIVASFAVFMANAASGKRGTVRRPI